MKVKIKNSIYDTQDTPIMLVFDDDNQRKTVAQHLSNMPEKDGVRKYAVFDDKIDKDEIKKFMVISDSQLKINFNE